MDRSSIEETNEQKQPEGGVVTEDLGEGVIIHTCPTFLTPDQASELFAHIMSAVKWEHSERTLRDGSTTKLPRLQAWMSTEYKRVPTLYQKSPPTVWTAQVLELKEKIENALQVAGGVSCCFDYMLINLYRDGEDSIGFHFDDEARGMSKSGGGPRNVIASISLGATRTFILRHDKKKRLQRRYPLPSGSLIVMDGTCQDVWRHGVPKEPEVKEPRINLTFRIS